MAQQQNLRVPGEAVSEATEGEGSSREGLPKGYRWQVDEMQFQRERYSGFRRAVRPSLDILKTVTYNGFFLVLVYPWNQDSSKIHEAGNALQYKRFTSKDLQKKIFRDFLHAKFFISLCYQEVIINHKIFLVQFGINLKRVVQFQLFEKLTSPN